MNDKISKYNGGPAFPYVVSLDRDTAEFTGMTLRDYFAAKAMQVPGLPWVDRKGLVTQAYKVADAMLKERDK